MFLKTEIKMMITGFIMGLLSCSANHGAPDMGTDSGDVDKVISGVVAAGAPVRGTVILKNANSPHAFLASTIEPDGHFSIHLIDIMTGPYILQARGTVGGRAVCLHTLGTRTDVSDTMNITPLTDLIVGHLTGRAPEDYFETLDNPALSGISTDENLDLYEALIKVRFEALLVSLGENVSQFNLLNTPFETDHRGPDALLDMIRVIPQWTEDGQWMNTVRMINILTGEELLDDLADSIETEGFDSVAASDIDEFTQALTDIASLFDQWSDVFDDVLPGATQVDLIDLFSEDFMFNGYDRSAFLAKICADSRLVGLSFSGISVDSISLADGTATISLAVEDAANLSQTLHGWSLIRSAGQWRIRGNQQILGVHAGAYAAYSQNEKEILCNGVCLYGFAPVASAQVDAVHHIAVTGPGIPLGSPVILARQTGDPLVFTRTDSQPPGFYRPIDGEGDPSPLRVTENACYTFTLYDSPEHDTILNPGGYTCILKKGYGDSSILLDRINVHAPAFSRSNLTVLSGFTGNDQVSCDWTLPPRVVPQTLCFVGSGSAGDFLLSSDLSPEDLAGSHMIEQTEIEVLDIHLRTLDEFDRTLDTFISKSVSGGRVIQAGSITDVNRLF